MRVQILSTLQNQIGMPSGDRVAVAWGPRLLPGGGWTVANPLSKLEEPLSGFGFWENGLVGEEEPASSASAKTDTGSEEDIAS